MKVPYDQLTEEFKQYFEHTAYGEEIIYAIYKRHGYCEISFWNGTLLEEKMIPKP